MAAAGLPTAGGEIAIRDIAMDAVRRDGGRVATCLNVVEELLAEDCDAPWVAHRFLEALQNTVSHGVPDLLTGEEILPLRGPRTAAAWETVDRFWCCVAAWCDENGFELQESDTMRAVQNRQLRSLLWPSCRSLADGRRVGLSHVIRYEKAVGVPMGGVAHEPVP